LKEILKGKCIATGISFISSYALDKVYFQRNEGDKYSIVHHNVVKTQEQNKSSQIDFVLRSRQFPESENDPIFIAEDSTWEIKVASKDTFVVIIQYQQVEA
jgi:hypothetical protein